jgi:hypothetical protein
MYIPNDLDLPLAYMGYFINSHPEAHSGKHVNIRPMSNCFQEEILDSESLEHIRRHCLCFGLLTTMTEQCAWWVQ